MILDDEAAGKGLVILRTFISIARAEIRGTQLLLFDALIRDDYAEQNDYGGGTGIAGIEYAPRPIIKATEKGRRLLASIEGRRYVEHFDRQAVIDTIERLYNGHHKTLRGNRFTGDNNWRIKCDPTLEELAAALSVDVRDVADMIDEGYWTYRNIAGGYDLKRQIAAVDGE